MIEINSPNITGANDAQSLAQIKSYLYQLSGQLNWAFSTLDVPAAAGTSDVVMVGGPTAPTKTDSEKTAETFAELKGLIIKSADIVNAYYTEISSRLEGVYVAQSEFGAYQEQVSMEMTRTAKETVESYHFDSRMDGIDESLAGFAAYQQHAEGFIRQGFIETDASGMPIIGIAIGQNLRSTTVTIEGQELEQLDSAQSCAFYTADKVSFRIGGNEVAYVSNRRLYIVDAQITGSLTVGDWLMTHDNSGLTLQWIGG